jgi:hypothetical protein
MRGHRLIPLLLIALALPAQAELSIQRITPNGDDIETGSQIVIAFNKPVVPLGRMERKADEVPVTIMPALPCQWRWLDPQTLACQLPDDGTLQAATRYTVEVRPELMTESGEKMSSGLTQTFITQRPALRYSNVIDWTAPTLPVIQLSFNQPRRVQLVTRRVLPGG